MRLVGQGNDQPGGRRPSLVALLDFVYKQVPLTIRVKCPFALMVGRALTVNKDCVRVRKSTVVDGVSEPMIKFAIESDRECPVAIQVCDMVPEEFSKSEVDFQDEGDYWRISESQVEFSRIIAPGDSLVTAYSVDYSEEDVQQFSDPPVISAVSPIDPEDIEKGNEAPLWRGQSTDATTRAGDQETDSAPENLQVTGVLDEEMFHTAFCAADLAVLPYLRTRQAGIVNTVGQSGIFNRCITYELPVLGSEQSYFEDLKQEWGCVDTFNTGDLNQAAQRIQETINDETKKEQLVTAMHTYGTEDSFEQVVEKHKDIYQNN